LISRRRDAVSSSTCCRREAPDRRAQARERARRRASTARVLLLLPALRAMNDAPAGFLRGRRGREEATPSAPSGVPRSPTARVRSARLWCGSRGGGTFRRPQDENASRGGHQCPFVVQDDESAFLRFIFRLARGDSGGGFEAKPTTSLLCGRRRVPQAAGYRGSGSGETDRGARTGPSRATSR